MRRSEAGMALHRAARRRNRVLVTPERELGRCQAGHPPVEESVRRTKTQCQLKAIDSSFVVACEVADEPHRRPGKRRAGIEAYRFFGVKPPLGTVADNQCQ